MRVCVLGATGMLGHKFVKNLGPEFEVFSVARQPFEKIEGLKIFKKERYRICSDLTNANELAKILDQVKPDAVVNAVGLTTRKLGAQAASQIILVNSWLPHRLREWCAHNNSRLIHFSTDCVFSGQKGNYLETDVPDAKDLYGRSKLLGEVADSSALTIRSSIVGREILGRTELIEWLISQKEKQIKGFTKVLYSGVTTNFMVHFVRRELSLRHLDFGLYQLASPTISKYELLQKVNQALGLGIEIVPDEGYVSDKSLRATRLYEVDPGADKPLWDVMISELVEEAAFYEGWSK